MNNENYKKKMSNVKNMQFPILVTANWFTQVMINSTHTHTHTQKKKKHKKLWVK